jgi:hypothetical protein
MKIGLALVLVMVGLGSAPAARAATIGDFDTFAATSVPFPASALATLSQFDPSLGTLTQVTLTLAATATDGSIAWDNEAPVMTDVSLGIGAQVTAVGPAALTAMAVPLQIDSATGIEADGDGAADFIGPDSFTVFVGGSGSDSGSSSLAAGLAPFVGLGT